MTHRDSAHTWWSLDLGDALLAFATSERIKDEFRTLHATAGCPTDMAVFTHREMGDLHCNVTVYFTPACAELAARFGALPGSMPMREGLELLCGAPGCWDVVFARR